jgi:hypothetical protein
MCAPGRHTRVQAYIEMGRDIPVHYFDNFCSLYSPFEYKRLKNGYQRGFVRLDSQIEMANNINAQDGGSDEQ